nr:uncharacterized protein LOC109183973 [Ipomoea batatas]GMC86778.1 uncharacterized protein LOC109183973 [Ipomoea batatas]
MLVFKCHKPQLVYILRAALSQVGVHYLTPRRSRRSPLTASRPPRISDSWFFSLYYFNSVLPRSNSRMSTMRSMYTHDTVEKEPKIAPTVETKYNDEENQNKKRKISRPRFEVWDHFTRISNDKCE